MPQPNSNRASFFDSTPTLLSKEIQARAMMFVSAAENNDQKTVDKLILDELENIEMDEDYFAPYMLALKIGGEKLAKMIIEALNNPEITNNYINYQLAGMFSVLLALFAVEQGHEGCMQELLLCNKDIRRGYYSQKPLHFAAELGLKRAVRILIETARDKVVNSKDDAGLTPLMHALRNRHDGLAQFLLEHHANANFCSFRGDTPLTIALCAAKEDGYQTGIVRTLIDKLKNVTAAKKHAERILDMKFVAHVCGIGKTVEFNKYCIHLEGFEPPYAMRRLSKYVEEFFKSGQGNSAISDNNKANIQECLANAFPLVSDPAEILSRIHARKPVVILGGIENHAISLVLSDDKLFVCNRARMESEDTMVSTTTAYSLPASSITESMIKDFIKTKPDMPHFNRLTSGLTRLDSECFSQKYQKTGNCCWASAKAAFLILCKQYTHGNTDYKRFSAWARDKAITDYCNRYIKSRDDADPLLDLIRGKEKLIHFLRPDLKPLPSLKVSP